MKFIDEYTFQAKAGRGGHGVVRWRREKFVPRGGPSGGNGGKGGDVVVEGVRDIHMLSRLIHTSSFEAERGADGEDSSKTGRGGTDCIIKLPIGSVITHTGTGTTWEVLREGDRIVILRGGAGGLGNEHFKSSSNVAPREHTLGAPGEEGTFFVELKLIADVGLVGLPNAGKSSLLNALTNAGAKVGAYEFTTLDPNLGAYHGYVLADIPGLIEGASEGRGLGHKFLRHISRTRLLVHCVALDRDEPLADYELVTKELVAYDPTYPAHSAHTLIALTKSDTATPERISEVRAMFAGYPMPLTVVSVLDDAALKAFGDTLSRMLERVE